MTTIKLNENWRMGKAGTMDFIPASVPGSVYADLLENGRMEDPYYRDNEKKALEIMEDDFEYVTTFDVPEALLAEEEVLLCFDGIDTLGDISLNGVPVASVDNMHRAWEFAVKGLVRASGNELKVVLHSPTRFIREAFQKQWIIGSRDAMPGYPYLRKANCMFGWDWGPRLPDAGIWKEVRLVGFSGARLDDVAIRQVHEAGSVVLRPIVGVERLVADSSDEEVCYDKYKYCFGKDDRKLKGLTLRITLTDPDGRQTVYGTEAVRDGIRVDQPRLWWPNGYGDQPLYQVCVELLSGGRVLDAWTRRIGLRTLTIHREKDEYGECFCHQVNGVDIFAMGANYIPEDNILARVTPERTFHLLLQAKNAHFNCIRVWGGGCYASDAFLDACDELGLIVWQDFLFACSSISVPDGFEENLRAEFVDNIKRMRHHACLGLFCGNNEMESNVRAEWIPAEQKRDYINLYEYILPKLVKQHAPDTFYWPASPSSGCGFGKTDSEDRGDVHYWEVWHGDRPFTVFRRHYFRYLSEFGFESFPSLKTCEAFTLPEDRNIFSYVMEKHQRSFVANGKIMSYLEQTFLYPTKFETILYASQLLQAEAMRYGVEHFRRNRGRCMGTLVWQLNDCWPVASWSSIDYFGRWKALHYYEKRFYAPILLSCEEVGMMTREINPNAYPFPTEKSIHLNVANETRQDVAVLVKWQVRDAHARILRQEEKTLTVPALSSAWLDKQELPDLDPFEEYVSYQCVQDGKEVSAGTVLFLPPKQFHFVDPGLCVETDGEYLVVKASAYARCVEILNEAEDMLLEDNYFDMDAGERRVKILSGTPAPLKLRSVYDVH